MSVRELTRTFTITVDEVAGLFAGMDNDEQGLPDASTEIRVPLHRGARFMVDTQRLWHAVWHPGDEPRYCLITSYTCGPELDAFISAHHPVPRIDVAPLDPTFAAAAEATAQKRREDRAAALAAQGADPTFGDGSLSSGAMTEVLSEA